MKYLDKEDQLNVSSLLESLDSELDYSSYLVGSGAETAEYSDIDIVIVTGDLRTAKEILEENNSKKKSFGNIEGSSMDRWNIQTKTEPTNLDITLHRPPYHMEIYNSPHKELR